MLAGALRAEPPGFAGSERRDAQYAEAPPPFAMVPMRRGWGRWPVRSEGDEFYALSGQLGAAARVPRSRPPVLIFSTIRSNREL